LFFLFCVLLSEIEHSVNYYIIAVYVCAVLIPIMSFIKLILGVNIPWTVVFLPLFGLIIFFTASGALLAATLSSVNHIFFIIIMGALCTLSILMCCVYADSWFSHSVIFVFLPAWIFSTLLFSWVIANKCLKYCDFDLIIVGIFASSALWILFLSSLSCGKLLGFVKYWTIVFIPIFLALPILLFFWIIYYHHSNKERYEVMTEGYFDQYED